MSKMGNNYLDWVLIACAAWCHRLHGKHHTRKSTGYYCAKCKKDYVLVDSLNWLD